MDEDHTDMEILVATCPETLSFAETEPREAYEYVLKYSSDQGLSVLYTIGPFGTKVAMTPAIGDLDGDNKADLVIQPVVSGLIYCVEFQNSVYFQPTEATINAIAWPCNGRNASRRRCAD